MLGVALLATSPTVGKPKAWILVDADRGVVLDASNDRVALPPASLTKLLTAVIAVSRLQPTDTLPVSARAAGEPASKINMQAGQVWGFQDSLYSLLLSSANDAAVAIAERVGGSLEGFATLMQQTAGQLGLQDSPVLQDPAGLDDSFSVDGGNLMSARDIAIVARDALAQPLIAQAVATPIYRFVGPDGMHHRLTNHNQLLRTYAGAIGMKTGYTAKSGEDLVAAARRNGRTMIAVVLGAPDLWTNATQLLDEGFATSQASTGTGDVLPPVTQPGGHAQTAAVAPPHRAPSLATSLPGTRPKGGGSSWPVVLVGLALPTAAVAVRRRQITVRRRRRARRVQPAYARSTTAIDNRAGSGGSANGALNANGVTSSARSRSSAMSNAHLQAPMSRSSATAATARSVPRRS